MIVVDASIVIDVLLQTPRGKRAGLQMFRERQTLSAPDLLPLEVLQVLRRYLLTKEISEDRAAETIDDFLALPITYYAHAPLVARIWQLWENFTAYDAAYLALTEAARAELFTSDGALRRSNLHRARVRVFE